MNRVTERINHVLLEYINQTYPEQNGRFLQLIMKLPELAAIRFVDFSKNATMTMGQTHFPGALFVVISQYQVQWNFLSLPGKWT